MMKIAAPCPNCSGGTLYSTIVEMPYLLPGLGDFFHHAHFQVVVCGNCGLTRLFADEEATAKLPESKGWAKLERADQRG